MKNKYFYLLGGVVILGILFLILNKNISFEVSPEPEKIEPTQAKIMNSQPTPKMSIDQSKTYTATLKTEKGDIVIALFADKTPITVNNFVYLARKGSYSNTVFHRTIKGFMIQGGDPEGTGRGGPGYRFDDEPFAGEYTRGTVAMANAGPDTNGSQFFIMHQDNDLPKNYVIFGKVTSGIESVDAIAENPVQADNQTPITPIKLLSVEIKEE